MNDAPVPMRPAQRFAAALKRHGVEYLFGQSNPPALTLAAHDLGITQIGYRQENAGAYMADGYARATGKVPVVTAQNGPALRNACRPRSPSSRWSRMSGPGPETAMRSKNWISWSSSEEYPSGHGG